MKKIQFLLLLIMPICAVFAQQEIILLGTVIDAKTQNPLQFVVVSVQNSSVMQLTSADGKFEFSAILEGDQYILLHSQGYKDILLPIKITSAKKIDLGILTLEENVSEEAKGILITLLESDLSDDNSSTANTSGLLQSSKDVFLQASAFNWGQARFRIRGLDSENAIMMINGVVMNKIYDGRPQWSNWGGLNDVLRNQEFSVGTTTSEYTFGGILGTQEINTQASLYRPGTRISFSGSNTSYNWRTMVSYASGMNSSGWAFVVAGGKRWADEGYFEGTSYDANSAFISIEKKINNKHSINFTGFYTPNSRAKNSPNTAEVTRLTNEKYNSYWGWQDGKKRNARIKSVEEPILILNHFFKINSKTQLKTSIAYQFGKIGNTNIDYQNANSPDPTYYRKMPSYYSSLYAKDDGEYSGAFTPDYENAEKSKLLFLQNQQLDWASIYRTNQKTITNSNGEITRYEPSKSHYILYEDRIDDKTFVVNSNINSNLSENIIFNGGISFRNLKSHNFQNVLDLLGGLYFEDIDAFYTGNQAQSDLQNPNRQVKKGDIYGYNYFVNANVINAFTQFLFNYRKVDFYLAQTFSSTNYQRDGIYQNGIYPTTSLGKSKKINFENFGFKGGLTYKISGKQWLVFNAAHLTNAPSIRNTFPNSRLNNMIVNGLKSETINSADFNYIHRTPKLKTRFTAYYATIKNSTKNSFFYAEGIFAEGAAYSNTDAFVSQTITNLNRKNIGIEMSFEYQILPVFKLTSAIAYGQFTYDNNPNVTITNDAQSSINNENPIHDFGTSILKNYKQAGMPQQAYSLGLEYRNPKYWWISINVNYLDKSYIDISPISRTAIFFRNPVSGLNFPEGTEEKARILLKQEKLNTVSLLNFTAGKSWRIKRKYIGLFISVNNVLGTSYKTGGFEQARNANFRELNQDVSSGTPSFGSKYYYGYGRTYFINLSISL